MSEDCNLLFILGRGLSRWPQDVVGGVTVRGRGTAQGCPVQAEDQPL